jgi:hypothetical protein
MQLKLLVSFKTITIELLRHETVYWILYENSTKPEVSKINPDLVDLDLLALTKIENVFVSLLKKVPERRPEERLWS